MNTIKLLGLCLIALTTLSLTGRHDTLSAGDWRGEFILENSRRIPFNLIVEGNGSQAPKVYLKNGTERAQLDSIYSRNDSLVMAIDTYDALLIGKITNGIFKGYYKRNLTMGKGLPFEARPDQSFRFPVSSKSTPASVAGKWSVNLITERDGKSSTRYTVGLLEQKGSTVTGTILTTTGDYRYLEGVVDGTKLKLSAFSGSGPTLIEADVAGNSKLTGEFVSTGGVVRLEAVKSDTAKLPDPYTLTFLKPGFDRLTFSFPDLNGKQVSLRDDKFKGKVVVLTVLGSWCPNCIDEAAFLAPWYEENSKRGVEVVGISFERKDDFNFAKARLTNLVNRFDIRYDILFAGIADKKVAASKLPELNTFLSFPTTLFIDKKGKVRKVHTGYNGPATGEYYQEYIKEFNDEVSALLKEPAETL